MQNYQDGGEAILEAFRNLGIDYVMSSPGSEWGPVWEALARQKVGNRPGPTYLSCWHETLAVNLAWGYTAITGRCQAVLLHAGAGLLQGSMGIHGATLTGMPMVILSGESLTYGDQEGFDPGRQWHGSLSVVGGPHRLLEPIVKWAGQATSAATLYEQVVRATEIAQRTPAGPTYISVPIENMLQEWARPESLRKVPPAGRTEAPARDIEAAAKLLVEAKYPLIITEAAGREEAGFEALVALAESLAIPVLENASARYANFPKSHPLYQGANLAPHRDEADLVLLVRSRVPWYPPSRGPKNATIIAVDEDPMDQRAVHRSLQANLYLEGDVPASLRGLTEAIRAANVDSGRIAERRARWQTAHEKALEACRAAEEEARTRSPIDPVWLCARLSALMPSNAIYVDETTTHRGAIQNHLRWEAPHDYVKVPSGLGQGLGAALGVKLACPDRPVVSVIGDGGFLYNPVTQCLGLSKEANLPILIVVFNNEGYNAMRANQLSYYPDGAGKQNDLFYGHPVNGPDYAELVAPFGGFGRRVDDPAALDDALRAGLAAVEDGRTAIVNVVLNR